MGQSKLFEGGNDEVVSGPSTSRSARRRLSYQKTNSEKEVTVQGMDNFNRIHFYMECTSNLR